MRQNLIAISILAVVGCGKAADKPAPAPAGSGSSAAAMKTAPPPPAAAKPQIKDDGAKQILAKGTTCKISDSHELPMDCAEYKAIGEYAFQKQGDAAVAETCAAFLTDPDLGKRLLAAECIYKLNAVGKTPVLGAALDALETEKDPLVKVRIAWGISGAEAVTAKLDDRVLAVVNKLAADPLTELAAGYLFASLFPQYMMGSGPKPPAKAQALAIDAIGRDNKSMQNAAFNAIRMLDDKPAVCAALKAIIRPDAKSWPNAAAAMAQLKDACVADVPRVIDLTLDQMAKGEMHLDVLKDFDRAFELDAPTRAKIAKACKASRSKAPDWERKSVDEVAAAFAKPKPH